LFHSEARTHGILASCRGQHNAGAAVMQVKSKKAKGKGEMKRRTQKLRTGIFPGKVARHTLDVKH
jgi:hypothetical protein